MQFYAEKVLQVFVGATLSMAILDPGCTKTVCGNTWLECFIETLSNEEKESVKTDPSLRQSKYQQRLLEKGFHCNRGY